MQAYWSSFEWKQITGCWYKKAVTAKLNTYSDYEIFSVAIKIKNKTYRLWNQVLSQNSELLKKVPRLNLFHHPTNVKWHNSPLVAVPQQCKFNKDKIY